MTVFARNPFSAPGIRRALVVGPAAAALLLAACGDAGEPDETSHGRTGLALTYDTLDDTDVAGFSFTATAVDCATGAPIAPPDVYTATEDLEDMVLPGDGIFVDAPFDADSEHLFSDHFFALPEGCYDVVVQPIDENGEPSEDCAPASSDNVEVVDGETTEILLISQCRGDGVGGLDVIAALNHPPMFTSIAYDPSKFICEGTTTICIEATDPDSDPMTITPVGDGDWTLVDWTEETVDGVLIACFEFSFPASGDYEIGFVVQDMGYDADGTQVTMEQLLAAQGDRLPSRDTISVPVHVLPEEDCIDTCGCPEGFEPTPAGDECIRVDETEVIVNGVMHEVCKAGASTAYGWAGAIFPGGLIDLNGFFTSRLNTVGVWACDPATSTVGTEPTQEWIGFSVCLDVEEAGDYVVGMAADNRIRFRVNGVPFFTLDTSDTENFNHWWMNPVSLGSGLNIIEMEGFNDHIIAAFGAEIYGPFGAGSLVDDAAMAAQDYPGNLMWSTLDIIGQPFLTGQYSGLSCPDGYALNTCQDELTCTQIRRVPCE